jgi:hypothetical protein
MTIDQNDVLADWVKGSGKNLTTIYLTHGQGDPLRRGTVRTGDTVAHSSATGQGCREIAGAPQAIDGFILKGNEVDQVDAGASRCSCPVGDGLAKGLCKRSGRPV